GRLAGGAPRRRWQDGALVQLRGDRADALDDRVRIAAVGGELLGRPAIVARRLRFGGEYRPGPVPPAPGRADPEADERDCQHEQDCQRDQAEPAAWHQMSGPLWQGPPPNHGPPPRRRPAPPPPRGPLAHPPP